MTFVRRNVARLPSYRQTRPRQYGSPTYSLLSTGFGYLNRITEVRPVEGKPFIIAEIAALSGPAKNVKKRHFSAKVTEIEVRNWMRLLAKDVENGRKVFIRFRMTDLANPASLDDGLQSHLLAVETATVDGLPVRLTDRRAA